MPNPHPTPGIQPERINLNDKDTTEAWTKKFNVTRDELRAAVAAVGDRAADVENHLKESRSSSWTDWMRGGLSTSR